MTDAEFRYYTGLPTLNYIKIILKYISPHLSDIKILTPSRMLLLTIAYHFRDLAYRYHISANTASRIFFPLEMCYISQA